MNKDLIFEIAYEAHMMGRVYTQGGEKNPPTEEFKLVDEMVNKMLAGVSQPKNKSEISRDNEIKMNMAKDILTAKIIDPSRQTEFEVNDSLLDQIVLVSEYIFNKVNE